MGSAVRALAETQGHQVVRLQDDGALDLIVVDGEALHPRQVNLPNVPILVVSDRRLKQRQVVDLTRGGATRVLDPDSSILDLAFAFSDLLFGTRVEQRRYANSLGGVNVEVAGASTSEGRLLCIARCGAILMTDQPLSDGTRIEMRMRLAEHPVSLRGRVAYTAESHVGIEFALDDVEVAPKLSSLAEESLAEGLGHASVFV